MRVEGREQGRKALRVPSFLDGPPEGETSRSDPDVGIAMVRQVHEGELAGERSTTVLPPPRLLLSPVFAGRKTSTNRLEPATGAGALLPQARSCRGSSTLFYELGWSAGVSDCPKIGGDPAEGPPSAHMPPASAAPRIHALAAGGSRR
jgi:hypothetical protein